MNRSIAYNLFFYLTFWTTVDNTYTWCSILVESATTPC